MVPKSITLPQTGHTRSRRGKPQVGQGKSSAVISPAASRARRLWKKSWVSRSSFRRLIRSSSGS